MYPPRNRRLSLRLALIASLLSLLSAGPAQLLSSAVAVAPSGAPATTVPAPAKAQNGLDASSAAAPSNPGGAGAPATTAASSPTTTYVPSAAVPPPATVPSTATSSVPTTPAATAVITRTPATSTAKGGDRPLSTATIAIVVLAALLILACAGWALARQRAFEPHWLVSLRHASAEAAFRASASWSEFTDWIRIGR